MCLYMVSENFREGHTYETLRLQAGDMLDASIATTMGPSPRIPNILRRSSFAKYRVGLSSAEIKQEESGNF